MADRSTRRNYTRIDNAGNAVNILDIGSPFAHVTDNDIDKSAIGQLVDTYLAFNGGRDKARDFDISNNHRLRIGLVDIATLGLTLLADMVFRKSRDTLNESALVNSAITKVVAGVGFALSAPFWAAKRGLSGLLSVLAMPVVLSVSGVAKLLREPDVTRMIRADEEDIASRNDINVPSDDEFFSSVESAEVTFQQVTHYQGAPVANGKSLWKFTVTTQHQGGQIRDCDIYAPNGLIEASDEKRSALLTLFNSGKVKTSEYHHGADELHEQLIRPSTSVPALCQ